MTDDEFNALEKKRRAYDEEFFSVVKKFYHHPAVYVGMRDISFHREIYEIIFSNKTDAEIVSELDKLAPPGTTYL